MLKETIRKPVLWLPQLCEGRGQDCMVWFSSNSEWCGLLFVVSNCRVTRCSQQELPNWTYLNERVCSICRIHYLVPGVCWCSAVKILYDGLSYSQRLQLRPWVDEGGVCLNQISPLFSVIRVVLFPSTQKLKVTCLWPFKHNLYLILRGTINADYKTL